MSEEHLLRAEAALRGSTSPITIKAFGVTWAAMGGIVNRQLECVKLTLVPCYEAVDLSPEALTAAVWSGEGLPPVGCVCENLAPGRPRPWTKVTIVGVDRGRAIYRLPDGSHSSDPVFLEGSSDKPLFRPLRTAEQLAAEAREATLKQIVKLIESADSRDKTIAEALYDAGLRFPDA